MDLNNFNIIWINYCTYLSETIIPKHNHDFFQFIYVVGGVGGIKIDEIKYTFQSGNIYLISPFVEHSFFNSDKSALKTLEIKFSLESAETEKLIKKLPVCMNVKRYPVKNVLLTIYEEVSARLPRSSEIIKLYFQLFLTYLLRSHESIQEGQLQDNSNEIFSHEMDKAMAYIYENLNEEISLEKLADIAGYEKNYFLRKFKARTKQTPMSFIKNKRIEKAKELLCYSDMNITQIATATGFKSIHYFSNVFFECTGIRPINYRNEKSIK